jgi:hypothetical protein
MSAANQYPFFKGMYDEECARQALLADRAKTYLSLITFYSAFMLFVAEKLKPETALQKTALALTIASILGGFLFSLLSIRVSKYETTNDPAKILHEFGKSPPDDETFFAKRIVDFAAAYEKNVPVNDGKALMLTRAGYLLLAGMVLHACYFFARIS